MSKARIPRFAAILGFLLPQICVAQGRGAASVPALPATVTPASRSIYVEGKVRSSDGRALPERIVVERVCNGIAYREGYTDSGGDFGLHIGALNSSAFLDASIGFDKGPVLGAQGAGSQTGLSEKDLAGCEIRANLPGYVSDSITLGFKRALESPSIGTIYLHPLTRSADYTSSATTAMAPRKAADAFESGMDSLQRQQWVEAEGRLRAAVREYPRYAIAWLELGRLYQRQNKVAEATGAYQEAIRADSKLEGPYRYLAGIAAARGAWKETVSYTAQLFRLNADVDAEFYFYSAVANHYLGNLGAALQHAREASRLDPAHQNPKIEHLLGILLAQMGDYSGAAERLNLYLKFVPSAPDAAAVREQLVNLEKGLSQRLNVRWIHGSDPCSTNKDVAFQVHAYDEDTFILRENKCINYEGPFIYLLFGQDKVFMLDSGAAPPAGSGIAFPMAATVQGIIDEWSKKRGKGRMHLVVAHSHAHGDHTGGDSQFTGRPDTTVVGKRLDDVKEFFGITDWPNQQATLDLGGRILDILPIPGHEATSIAVYDRKSRILLTGDTVYPGRLYIRDWPVFKASIGRLAAFVKTHDIAYVLGAHIEMTNRPGVDYPIRTTYQPEEHVLEMTAAHIVELYEAIQKMGETAVREVHDDFITYPR